MAINHNNSSHDYWSYQLYSEEMGISATPLGNPPTTISCTPTSLQPVNQRRGKRRSRTPKRAPTTIVNTDEANFRAMVQQFTGLPETAMIQDYHPRNFNGYVGDSDQTHHEIRNYSFSLNQHPYEQFQEYVCGYGEGAQIGVISSEGESSRMVGGCFM